MNLRPKAAVVNNSNLAPNVFLNFVQYTSFSIVLNFGVKLSIRVEYINKLRKMLLYMVRFCEDFGEPIRKSQSESVHGLLEGFNRLLLLKAALTEVYTHFK